METGANKERTATETGKFPGREHDQALSIGLSFGSDFFSVWHYADKFGEDCIGESTLPPAAESLTSAGYPGDTLPVFALSFSPAFTLLPKNLFEESEVHTTLKFVTGYTGRGTAEFDQLPETDAVLVYEDADRAQDILDRSIPGLKLHHAAGHLLRVLRAASTGGTECFLFSRGKAVFIFVFSDGKPLMVNSLNSENTIDILYFTLFALKQVAPVPAAEVKTVLLGEAADRDDLRDALAEYIRDVTDILDINKIEVSGNPDPKTFSRHIIGYTAKLCA